jgi:uncharacterized protein with HEPN domain
MRRSIRLRLNDILRAIDGAVETIADGDYDTFRTVFHIARTVERCIEIVSEATRHIPEDIRARYPHIPWRQVAAIGNVLRHNYDIIDDRIIWEIATVHFPALRAVVAEIRSQLPNED